MRIRNVTALWIAVTDPFPSDCHRVEYLFILYEKITAPLVAAAKPTKKRRKVSG